MIRRAWMTTKSICIRMRFVWTGDDGLIEEVHALERVSVRLSISSSGGGARQSSRSR